MNGIYIQKNKNLTPYTIVINDNFNSILNDYNFTNCNILDYIKIIGYKLYIYYNNDCIKFNKNLNIRASIINKKNIYGDCIIICETLNLDILAFNYIFNKIKTNKINNIDNHNNYLYLDMLYDESTC
jgi:hypothetical protein